LIFSGVTSVQILGKVIFKIFLEFILCTGKLI